MDPTLFQYCQKIAVLSNDRTSVLLCRRRGEADYDGVFSFIGGKLEVTDEDRIPGRARGHTLENINRAGIECVIVVPLGPDGHDVAVDGNGNAEEIIRPGVARGELGDLVVGFGGPRGRRMKHRRRGDGCT